MCQALNSRVEVTRISKIYKPSHRLKEEGLYSFKNRMDRKIFERWKPILTKYKTQKNVELEIRFGRSSTRGFDTNIGNESYMKVLKALEKYDGWEQKTRTKWDVYYFEDGKRLQINEETDERQSVVKKRVLVDDFELEGHPFDVRLGVSTETEFNYDGETATDQKTKERWSFVRKNLSIDVTKVVGNPEDPDADDDTSYQIELEIIDPLKLTDQNDATYKLLYKIFDVLKCL